MSTTVIVERDIRVQMRDGVRLATDVYRPKGDGPWPVLLERTPYGKSFAWFTAGLIVNPLVAVERGYAVVVQDTRGRSGSQGPSSRSSTRPTTATTRSSGRRASRGATAPWASSARATSASRPCRPRSPRPHLKAGVSYLTGANYHNGWTYWAARSSCRSTSGGRARVGHLRPRRLRPKEREATLAALAEVASDWETAARHLPLAELPAFKKVAPYWREWLEHPSYDAFWKRVDQTAKAGGLKVPLLQVAGWFDNFARGHFDLLAAMSIRGRAKGRSRIVIGPWDHEAYSPCAPPPRAAGSSGRRPSG